MLHYIIANGICCLTPGEDRLTKTVIIDINDKGKILNYNIVKSVINSKKKMNYDDVDKLLVDNICIDEYIPFENLLKTLHEATNLLESIAKNNQGKLDFPSDELNKTYDEFGNITSVTPFEQTEARKLIEYHMIAANQCVATYLYWQQIPSIYRIHDIPDLKKINETLKSINDSDVNIKFKALNNVNSPKVIQQILHKLSDLEEYPIIASILLQDMQRAEYNIQNIGHYALGLEFYTHFTAPIRRLNDLLIHMILDILLESPEELYEQDFKKMETYLQEASKQASRIKCATIGWRGLKNLLDGKEVEE
jgi:ribonuclease R